MASRHLIVGTAGHIDHGKTSLVRSLTGVDLDTLPEERVRGITIALGFTPLDLPSGRRIAMVDVPGHERLVRTMVAGAHGLDAVMLVVSAVDGVMPQTVEHTAILGLLGVQTGFVVLTMRDLVDDDLFELARDDVESLIAGTFLEGAPIVSFSSVTGEGRDEILGQLESLEPTVHREHQPFRLYVDRAFSQTGFGTVVTGTTTSGELNDNEPVRLLPHDKPARVRGIQVHGAAVQAVGAGTRTALNLAGVAIDDVPRGTLVVTHPNVPSPSMVDVVYTHTHGGVELNDGASVRLLLGTAEVIGRLYLASELDGLESGDTAAAQIRLERPLPCMPGDRFVIRRTSPVDTLGGGEVVDPWAPKMSHRTRVSHGLAIHRLHLGDHREWLERAGEGGLPERQWRNRCKWTGNNPEVATFLAGRAFSSGIAARLSGVLLEALAAHHGANPLALGAHRRELRRARLGHLDETVFDALLEMVASTKAVVLQGPLVRAANFAVALNDAEVYLSSVLVKAIEGKGIEGLDTATLHKQHPAPEVAALVHLLEARAIVHTVPSMGLVSTLSLEALRTELSTWFANEPLLTPSRFKEMTGLTRKNAIPLLEWLDRHRITRRVPDGRKAGSDLAHPLRQK